MKGYEVALYAGRRNSSIRSAAARARCILPIYMQFHGRRARAIFRVSHGSGTVPSHGTTTSKMIDRSPFWYRYEKLTLIGVLTN